MEKLKDISLLLGKDPADGRLLVAIEGTGKSVKIGSVGSVPSTVSRCRPAENTAHARLSFSHDGTMALSNLNPKNVTYVNGMEIASKRIDSKANVELGREHFTVNLPLILEAVSKVMAAASKQGKQESSGQETKSFNISHLEHVWHDTQRKRKEMREKQKKVNLIRSGCGLFTMCAMPCIYFIGEVGYILTGLGVVGNLYSFIGLKNDDTAERAEALNEEFQERYVCPNPECNKFLGNMSYKLLKKQTSMKCPYCKSEFTETK